MTIQSTIRALLTAVILLGSAAPAFAQSMTGYTASEESRMWVEGTSTIHDWECPVGDFTAELRASLDGDAVGSFGRIVVNATVESIDCDKNKMNRKLRDALVSDDHPAVTFEAETAEITADDDGRTASSAGSLTMAGETRDLTVDAALSTTEDGRPLLTGHTSLLLSDFGIDPPTALLGTLKTGDEVFVRFEVVLEPREAN